MMHGSLPHRQLRNNRRNLSSGSDCSLPHRQLRNTQSTTQRCANGSLPHRQLRKAARRESRFRYAFTAA